ncbi:uncharacterized protein MONOS_550 [Monocercomonoides exilis]|uniref:uncharacterized protein n=1 Tax=Monocercomonoides exilis TaxID=2049356 RepID=UPI0035599E5D|nr:hypothetical protein MONOS_550 [Monocercomonoides exilis]|eukprot:MONOS_550.1-p1 / transcript=MONOS_550.1 / gene=MONOS_550 / organism=Monocercomonoides_exilis_PA203 / gene_product=unspecified product / transcript_product=unspecified product / location=Mono_scaffold00009:1767-6767(-) / protein_length=1429 / sequence_SO=supercontig / SO=protein_coding / is_pseudo=false
MSQSDRAAEITAWSTTASMKSQSPNSQKEDLQEMLNEEVTITEPKDAFIADSKKHGKDNLKPESSRKQRGRSFSPAPLINSLITVHSPRSADYFDNTNTRLKQNKKGKRQKGKSETQSHSFLNNKKNGIVDMPPYSLRVCPPLDLSNLHPQRSVSPTLTQIHPSLVIPQEMSLQNSQRYSIFSQRAPLPYPNSQTLNSDSPRSSHRPRPKRNSVSLTSSLKNKTTKDDTNVGEGDQDQMHLLETQRKYDVSKNNSKDETEPVEGKQQDGEVKQKNILYASNSFVSGSPKTLYHPTSPFVEPPIFYLNPPCQTLSNTMKSSSSLSSFHQSADTTQKFYDNLSVPPSPPDIRRSQNDSVRLPPIDSLQSFDDKRPHSDDREIQEERNISSRELKHVPSEVESDRYRVSLHEMAKRGQIPFTIDFSEDEEGNFFYEDEEGNLMIRAYGARKEMTEADASKTLELEPLSNPSASTPLSVSSLFMDTSQLTSTHSPSFHRTKHSNGNRRKYRSPSHSSAGGLFSVSSREIDREHSADSDREDSRRRSRDKERRYIKESYSVSPEVIRELSIGSLQMDARQLCSAEAQHRWELIHGRSSTASRASPRSRNSGSVTGTPSHSRSMNSSPSTSPEFSALTGRNSHFGSNSLSASIAQRGFHPMRSFSESAQTEKQHALDERADEDWITALFNKLIVPDEGQCYPEVTESITAFKNEGKEETRQKLQEKRETKYKLESAFLEEWKNQEAQFSELQEKYEEIRQKYEELRGHAMDLGSTNERGLEEAERNEQELKLLRAKVKQLEAETQAAQSETAFMKTQDNNWETQCNELKEQNKEFSDNAEKLQLQLKNYTDEITEKDERIAMLKKERDELKKLLAKSWLKEEEVQTVWTIEDEATRLLAPASTLIPSDSSNSLAQFVPHLKNSFSSASLLHSKTLPLSPSSSHLRRTAGLTTSSSKLSISSSKLTLQSPKINDLISSTSSLSPLQHSPITMSQSRDLRQLADVLMFPEGDPQPTTPSSPPKSEDVKNEEKKEDANAEQKEEKTETAKQDNKPTPLNQLEKDENKELVTDEKEDEAEAKEILNAKMAEMRERMEKTRKRTARSVSKSPPRRGMSTENKESERSIASASSTKRRGEKGKKGKVASRESGEKEKKALTVEVSPSEKEKEMESLLMKMIIRERVREKARTKKVEMIAENDVVPVLDWTEVNENGVRGRFGSDNYDWKGLGFAIVNVGYLKEVVDEKEETITEYRAKLRNIRELFYGICGTLRKAATNFGEKLKLLFDSLDNIKLINDAQTVDLCCPYCLQLFKEPVTFIPCGHTLCKICAYRTGKAGKTQCPLCSDCVTRGFVKNFIVESLSSREEVKRQKIQECLLGACQLEEIRNDLIHQAKLLPSPEESSLEVLSLGITAEEREAAMRKEMNSGELCYDDDDDDIG